MRKTILALILGLVLASCGSPLPPIVVPNTQAGAYNNQTVGETSIRPVVRPSNNGDVIQTQDTIEVKSEKVEKVTINHVNWWMIALLFLFWQLPSPTQIGNSISQAVVSVANKIRGKA